VGIGLDGNLAREWVKIQRDEPYLARAVRESVDGEKPKSREYYEGYRGALYNLIKLFPNVVECSSEPSSFEFSKSVFCAASLAYLEYILRVSNKLYKPNFSIFNSQ